MNTAEDLQIKAGTEIEEQLDALLQLWSELDSSSNHDLFSYKLIRWQHTTAKIIERSFGTEEHRKFKKVSDSILNSEDNDDSLELTKNRLQAYLQALLEEVWRRPDLLINNYTNDSIRVAEQSIRAIPIQVPEKITLSWIFTNATFKLWLIFGGILIFAFLSGFYLGQTNTGKDIVNSVVLHKNNN